MANDLKLRVLLNAVDKVTAPLRGIHRQSGKTAQAMKAARDTLKGLDAAQKQVGEFRQLKQGLMNTRSALDQARAKTRELGQQLALTQTPTKAMRREFEQAKLALERLKQQTSGQGQQLNQLRQRLKATGIDTRNLGEHERRLKGQMVDTNQQIENQRRRLQALTQQQRRLTQARNSYQQGQQMAGNLAGKGATGLAAGGAALYSGARMIAPGVEFDASMSKTQAITRLDKNSPELKALRDQARELGGSTMFTAGQASDAQGFLGMAGFDPKAIKAAMPGMLNLAAAGGTELAETADIASNIMSGLGMTADQMNTLGDVLVGTFTRANTDLRKLGETMKYAAPMAKTYGVDLETAAAMAGKLGDAGLQGSMGGTALSSIMNRLAAPPKAAAKALDELKIKTADAEGNLRPLPDILKEIHDRTAQMGTADRGGLLKAIAGEEAVKGMAQLVDQAGSGELQALIATLRQTQGEANKTAKVMADNLKGDITTLKSAWADLGIEIEEQQDGPLRDLVKSITDIIRAVKSWASENPALADTLVKIAAGIAITSAVLGALTLAAASILGPFVLLRFLLAQVGIGFPGVLGLFRTLATVLIGPLMTALRAVSIALWGLAANPIALAVAAVVAALVGGAYLIYQNWDAVKAYFSSAWEEIKAGFSGGIGGILTTLANFSPIGLIYQAFAAVLSYLGVDLPSRFSEFGNMIIRGLIDGLFAGLGQIREAITTIGDSTIGWFKEKLGIQSPSRVFAELGGFTMEGLTQGLENGQQGPLNALTQMSRDLTTAGNLALGGTPIPALTFDDRPPISGGGTKVYDSHDTYEFNFPASPGQDMQAMEKTLRALLTRIDNEKAARRRSRLADSE